MNQFISIIIPVLNEKAVIAETAKKIKHPLVQEIIVVDGGSTDGTVEAAESAGCKVIFSKKKGRASQMNAGADAAKSPILYFLHSDTLPPDGFAEKIIHAVRNGADYGCFSLKFDDPSLILKFFACFTRLKGKWLRFGDQSLFVKKEIFKTAGGFDESLTVMEDQEIFHRMGKIGTFKLINDSVMTSARRYREIGILKLQFFFTLIYLGYYLGVSQNILVHFYKKHLRTE